MGQSLCRLSLLYTAFVFIGHFWIVDAQQEAFSTRSNSAFANHEDHSINPLDALSNSYYTTLQHPQFPKHSVRVKKSHFCDPTVDVYTGYIDVQAKHLFFYFFESRNDPDRDDVIFWTNGGPGGSSSIGLFFELGPCRTTPNGTVFFEHSWNSNANVFFVDQPVGVGFSYAEYGERVSRTEEAAVDIAAFVSIFFEHFTKFKGRAFHMAGESYGGRYIPLFASEIYDQNKRLVQAGLTPINLTSVMIGNGMTDVFTQLPFYADFACSSASGLPPVQSISSCVRMKQIASRCNKWTKRSCVEYFDAIDCSAAMSFCNSELVESVYAETGLSPYDLTKPCEGDFTDACYAETSYIRKYLNRADVRKTIGIDPSFGNFTTVSMDVNSAFEHNLDSFHPTQLYVSSLLERDVKVLIYVGTYDFICNWLGNEAWTLNLEWSGQEEFRKQELREWSADGANAAGKVRSAGGLTFATVYGAGHMVPYDKPKEALEMVNRWTNGFEILK